MRLRQISSALLRKVPVPNEIWLLAVIILIGAFLVSPGFFLIDEAIYFLGARAVTEGGALGIHNNGFDQFHSDALKLLLLVDGPQGLTPQYPAGSALITAPLLPLLGARAFILLNAGAAILTLFTVRKICLSQYDSEKVARIAIALLVAGTFWLEYAVGIWPHMLATFFAVQAFWLALRHLELDDKRNVILSGLFAGAGILFRLDAAVSVPAIGLIMVVYAPRFVRSCFLFGAAVSPSLALASWLNYLKFGELNPFSYGKSVGNTNLTAHGALLAALCIGFGALLLWRRFGWRLNRRATLALLVIAGGALLVIPATNTWLLRFWNGFIALVVDMRAVKDNRIGVQPAPGDTRLFWNLAKKSLGQSMPWVGLAALLLTSGIPKGERRFIGTLLIFIVAMTLPFILLSWHGGLGSNMRYFLPVLPALCILCAKVIFDLWRSVPNAIVFAVGGTWAAIALCLAWAFVHPSGYVGVQQIVSTYFFLATVVAALGAGYSWPLQHEARKLAIALFGGGLIISMSSALADFQMSQIRRAQAHANGEWLSDLPQRSLVITFPEWAVTRIPGNDSILATRDPQTGQTDPQLVIDALDKGYRVFMDSFEFEPKRSIPPGVETFETKYSYPDGRIIELRRQRNRPAASP